VHTPHRGLSKKERKTRKLKNPDRIVAGNRAPAMTILYKNAGEQASNNRASKTNLNEGKKKFTSSRADP
jgi:hypothetical protein